jgi:GMP synthase (glutamine-hydrolysing)
MDRLHEKLNLNLLKPSCELFKDKVHELKVALDLPKPIEYCHSFSGQVLGVRILGEGEKEFADLLR